MAEQHEFEQTLDQLEHARRAKEQEYFEHLRELEARVGRLSAAAASAESLAAERQPPVPEPLPEAAVGGELPGGDALPPADQEPWPSAGAWMRRRLNAVVRWALRDYLAVLDSRHRGIARGMRAQGEALTALSVAAGQSIEEVRRHNQEICDRALDQSRGWTEGSTAATESLREALNRTVESLDLLVGTAERLRLLADAKDAETLQRSVHGPARKMELMFEEFARQQEALLAELVGRRQEIDEIIRQRGERDAS